MGRRPEGGVWEGYPRPHWGKGLGRLLLRIFSIFCWKYHICFLHHTSMGGVLTPLTPSSVRHWRWVAIWNPFLIQKNDNKIYRVFTRWMQSWHWRKVWDKENNKIKYNTVNKDFQYKMRTLKEVRPCRPSWLLVGLRVEDHISVWCSYVRRRQQSFLPLRFPANTCTLSTHNTELYIVIKLQQCIGLNSKWNDAPSS